MSTQRDGKVKKIVSVYDSSSQLQVTSKISANGSRI